MTCKQVKKVQKSQVTKKFSKYLFTQKTKMFCFKQCNLT